MVSSCIARLGAYLPLLRLDRKAAARALAWSGLGGPHAGSRAVAGWDEDALTMAVEAARAAISVGQPPHDVVFASTSSPFFDRAQAPLAIHALGLPQTTRSQDTAGTRRAATTALMRALEGASSTLVLAGERRPTQPGSAAQLSFGDGGAAALTHESGGLRYLGGASISHDFMDMYSAREKPFPYVAEERFVREVSVADILAPTIRAACASAGIEPGAIAVSAMAEPVGGVYAALARALGMTAPNTGTGLAEKAGDLGAAHPLFALALACARAKPGDILLLVGFGSGCDALFFELTGAVPGAAEAAQMLQHGLPLTDYIRFLSLTGSIDLDWGVRAEFEQKAQAPVLSRYGVDMLGFVGGRDRRGNVQFPKTRMPVDPQATGPEELEDVRLADEPAMLVSVTTDRLNTTPDPPFQFGLAQFANGARVMMEMTDQGNVPFTVGQSVGMRFRIKSLDRRRGFRTYFWKAAPAERPMLES